jgi:hypothetical protein
LHIAVLLLLSATAIAGLCFVRYLLRPLPIEPAFIIRGKGKYACAVAGTARFRSAVQSVYRDAERESDTAAVEAVLVPQHEERVLVQIKGKTVGCLPKDLAEEYHALMAESGYPDQQCLCKARITLRLHQGIGGHADYMLRLDMPARCGSLDVEQRLTHAGVGTVEPARLNA